MKQTKELMGMPITVEIRDPGQWHEAAENVFDYFREVDLKFSTYKNDSEINRFNRGEINESGLSAETRAVFELAEQSKQKTNGYFEIRKPDGSIDPSGLVKGWAILNAAHILQKHGCKYFYVDAGGDVQAQTPQGAAKWKVGIRSPFNRSEIIKTLDIENQGVATSGTYIRGQHIYDPHQPGKELKDVVSITVISDNVYKADVMATAAFAMGLKGIEFIRSLQGYEAYQVDAGGNALMTPGFTKYVAKN